MKLKRSEVIHYGIMGFVFSALAAGFFWDISMPGMTMASATVSAMAFSVTLMGYLNGEDT